MYQKRILLTFALICITATILPAADTFTVTADYSTPIGNDKIDPSFGLGLMYRFWGVFTFSATMYTELLFGADNVFNIREVRPIGLFSGGLGMKIPLGAFNVTFGWQKFFTGTVSTQGVFPFADSYSIGAAVDLSNSFGIEIFSRRLFGFSEQAVADSALRIESREDTVETVGVGVHFNLF